MDLTTEDIAAGFATALSKLFGPGVLCELLGDCMNAPPKEPTVIRVGDRLADATHLLHRHGGNLCSTIRIHGACSRCTCGAVIWDDR